MLAFKSKILKYSTLHRFNIIDSLHFLIGVIIVIPFIPTTNINAQNTWSLKGGINYSTFWDDHNKSAIAGISVGVSRYWSIENRIGIVLEINYTEKGGILNNKAIGPYQVVPQIIYTYNIETSVGFLEIPISLEYDLIKNRKWVLKFYPGIFLSFPIVDNSELTQRLYYFTYDPDNPEHRSYNFEYYYYDASGFGIWNEDRKQNWGLILGTKIKYINYFLEVRYTFDLEALGFVNRISRINKKLHSIRALVGINL